jgi:hypothetical protein
MHPMQRSQSMHPMHATQALHPMLAMPNAMAADPIVAADPTTAALPIVAVEPVTATQVSESSTPRPYRDGCDTLVCALATWVRPAAAAGT